MDSPAKILTPYLLSGLMAACVFLLRGKTPLPALALLLSSWMTQFSIFGLPDLPPREALHWFPLIFLAWFLADTSLHSLSVVQRLSAIGIFLILALGLIFSNPIRGLWSIPRSAATLLGFAALGATIITQLRFSLSDRSPRFQWLMLLFLSGILAASLGATGSLSFAQLQAVTIAWAAGFLASSMVFRKIALAPAPVTFASMIFVLMSAVGMIYSGLPAGTVCAFALSFSVPRFFKGPKQKTYQWAWTLALGLIALLIALWSGGILFPSSDLPY